MKILQLIYSSQPFGYDELVLGGILAIARRNNERDGITGALICREDLFLQLLEGGESEVTQAFDRISRDDRHVDVVNRWSRHVEHRLFPDWAMRHDPARSWMWTAEEVRRGAVDDASSTEVRDVFIRLSKEPAAAVQL